MYEDKIDSEVILACFTALEKIDYCSNQHIQTYLEIASEDGENTKVRRRARSLVKKYSNNLEKSHTRGLKVLIEQGAEERIAEYEKQNQQVTKLDQYSAQLAESLPAGHLVTVIKAQGDSECVYEICVEISGKRIAGFKFNSEVNGVMSDPMMIVAEEHQSTGIASFMLAAAINLPGLDIKEINLKLASYNARAFKESMQHELKNESPDLLYNFDTYEDIHNNYPQSVRRAFQRTLLATNLRQAGFEVNDLQVGYPMWRAFNTIEEVKVRLTINQRVKNLSLENESQSDMLNHHNTNLSATHENTVESFNENIIGNLLATAESGDHIGRYYWPSELIAELARITGEEEIFYRNKRGGEKTRAAVLELINNCLNRLETMEPEQAENFANELLYSLFSIHPNILSSLGNLGKLEFASKANKIPVAQRYLVSSIVGDLAYEFSISDRLSDVFIDSLSKKPTVELLDIIHQLQAVAADAIGSQPQGENAVKLINEALSRIRSSRNEKIVHYLIDAVKQRISAEMESPK